MAQNPNQDRQKDQQTSREGGANPGVSSMSDKEKQGVHGESTGQRVDRDMQQSDDEGRDTESRKGERQ